MIYSSSRALELLQLNANNSNATFRDGQEEAIRHVVENRGRLLVVQKTGWGKSLVYFIANKLMREAGLGPGLLVSPLLALMRNQIAAAIRMGVRAFTINSDNQNEWNQVEQKLRSNEVDILLISPERLANERFRSQVLSRISSRIALLVIDEAHCISDWGHDFRPHYRLLERVVRTLPNNLRLLATTATANNRVMADLTEVLGPKLTIFKGDLNRPSLKLQTIRLLSQADRLAWLADQLPQIEGHGIIYTLTVRDAVQVSRWLRSRGLEVEAYTGETAEGREQLENALLNNQLKALVATPALGMGFDKPDLAFVVHFQAPGSVVAYYQQVGRAGRAINAAYGVLLSGSEETDITNYFIDSAFPSRSEVKKILDALEIERNGLSLHELLGRVNLSYRRIQTTIDLLALESPSPIAKLNTKWRLTSSRLHDSFWERTERLTNLRRSEQVQMQQYVKLQSGHMKFLIDALDGVCSEIGSVELPALPLQPSQSMVIEALRFLRRSSLEIEPRKQWPTGGLPVYRAHGRISPDLQYQTGRALCAWNDAGWGELVQLGKYKSGCFDQDLIVACERLIREWNPQPAPAWVTYIPSLRHPVLVADFARRLANRINLPFREVLVKRDNRPQQKSMANSAQQARNLDGAFSVNKHSVIARPVLLVDDMVDSRWTFTVAAWLLRMNGAGEVFPLALASTSHA